MSSKRKSEAEVNLERLLKKVKAIEEEISTCLTACQSNDDGDDNGQDGGQDAANNEDGIEIPEDNTVVEENENRAQEENRPQDDTKENAVPELDEEALKILGEDPTSKAARDLDLPSSVSTRWVEWLKSGIKKEVKEEILAKYARQGNIELEAPTLNQELLVFLNDAAKKRDKHFCATQNLAGTALSSLSCALKQILFWDKDPVDRLVLLEELSDTAKMLIEIHKVQSKARIAYIMPSVSKEFRTILEKTKPDKFLFGADLATKIKDAKEVAKIGKDYKPMGEESQAAKKGPKKTTPLNSRDPSQKAGHSGQDHSQKSFTKNRFINWSQKNRQGQAKTPFRPNNRFNQ